MDFSPSDGFGSWIIISENKGKLLENMVLLEFIKSGYEVFYFKEKYECDFVIKKDNNFHAIQVSWTTTDDNTKDREIRGLIEACQKLNILDKNYHYIRPKR